MGYYPALLDLEGRPVLVVGGGQVAARKIAALVEAGAKVRVVAPKLAPETREVCEQSGVAVESREFAPKDVAGAWLVVSATDIEKVNRAVADAAEEAGVFVNVVDVQPLCSFIVPASVRRGELILAVSTSGASPAAARRLRQRLEKEFGPQWEPYLDLMRAVRARLTSLGRPAKDNKPLFYALVDSDLFEAMAEGDAAKVELVLARELGPGFSLAEIGWSADQLIPGKEDES